MVAKLEVDRNPFELASQVFEELATGPGFDSKVIFKWVFVVS